MAANRSHDDPELTAFMREVTPSLLRTAWLLTGEAGRAQEAGRAALVRTCVAWPRVRDEDALGCARRVLVSHRTGVWRRSRRELARPRAREGSVSDEAAGGAEPRGELVGLLDRLPARQRSVIVLRYGNDLSERAVADLLDLPEGAVRNAAARGLAVLGARRAAAPSAAASAEGEAHGSTRPDDELRTALAEAPAPPMAIDLDDVLRRGRRAVRTRRAGLAAGMAALLAVSVALLGPRERTLGGPDLTGTVRRPVSAALVLGSEHFAATISSVAGDTNLDFYRIDPSGHRQRVWGRSTEGLGSGASFGNAGPNGAILGVVPSDAVSVSALLLGRPRSASEVAVAPLPGTGYEAVGVLPQDPTLTSRFLGVGWVNDRGVRSTSVPSSDTVATFTLPGSGNQVSVWTDVPERSWGVYLGDAAQTAGLPLGIGRGEVTWPSLPDRVRDDPSHRDNGFAYGLLPEGATDVWFTLAPGARASGTVETQALPGAHLTAFVLELDRPTVALNGHQLRALSWANPDGTRSEHTFP